MAPSATLLVYFPGNAAAVQTLIFPVAQVRISEQINWNNVGFSHKEPPAFCKVWSAAKKFPSLIREFWIVGGRSLFGHTTKSNIPIPHLKLQKIKLHTMHFLPCILNLHFFFKLVGVWLVAAWLAWGWKVHIVALWTRVSGALMHLLILFAINQV